MTTQNGRAFNEWLRAQLKAKKMSQRQLAQQSGVDHSTISRLIRGDRMPSLGTATKLARGLRELRDDADTPQYLGLVAAGSTNPTARVEYALRADDLLSEPQVRQIMEYYLAVRMRRFGRAFPPAAPPAPARNERQRATDRPMGAGDGRPPMSARGQRAQPDRSGRRDRRQHRPIRHTRSRPGTRAASRAFQGTTRIALHRPGLGDSERRRLGRRRSHSGDGPRQTQPRRRPTPSGRAPPRTGRAAAPAGRPGSGVPASSAGPPQSAPIASRNSWSHSTARRRPRRARPNRAPGRAVRQRRHVRPSQPRQRVDHRLGRLEVGQRAQIDDAVAIDAGAVRAAVDLRPPPASAAGKPPSGWTAGGRCARSSRGGATTRGARDAPARPARAARRTSAAAPIPTSTNTIGSANAW